jgi:hypothetical protein
MRVTRIAVGRDPRLLSTNLFVLAEDGEGNEKSLVVSQWDEVNPQESIEPSCRIEEDVLARFMDDLWNLGFRPHHSKIDKLEAAPMGEHIKDLRSVIDRLFPFVGGASNG